MKYSELTEKIIGCAYRVYNRMGYGFLESVYEKCLLIELKKNRFVCCFLEAYKGFIWGLTG